MAKIITSKERPRIIGGDNSRRFSAFGWEYDFILPPQQLNNWISPVAGFSPNNSEYIVEVIDRATDGAIAKFEVLKSSGIDWIFRPVFITAQHDHYLEVGMMSSTYNGRAEGILSFKCKAVNSSVDYRIIVSSLTSDLSSLRALNPLQHHAPADTLDLSTLYPTKVIKPVEILFHAKSDIDFPYQGFDHHDPWQLFDLTLPRHTLIHIQATGWITYTKDTDWGYFRLHSDGYVRAFADSNMHTGIYEGSIQLNYWISDTQTGDQDTKPAITPDGSLHHFKLNFGRSPNTTLKEWAITALAYPAL